MFYVLDSQQHRYHLHNFVSDRFVDVMNLSRVESIRFDSVTFGDPYNIVVLCAFSALTVHHFSFFCLH